MAPTIAELLAHREGQQEAKSEGTTRTLAELLAYRDRQANQKQKIMAGKQGELQEQVDAALTGVEEQESAPLEVESPVDVPTESEPSGDGLIPEPEGLKQLAIDTSIAGIPGLLRKAHGAVKQHQLERDPELQQFAEE